MTDDLLARFEGADANTRAEVLRLIGGQSRYWSPQRGPQLMAFYSTADILGYGGAAGGGKTELLLGLALESHRRSLILRRESTQNQGNAQRLLEIVGNDGGYAASPTPIWTYGNRRSPSQQITFGGMPHPGTEKRWAGRARDLLGFDEATHFTEMQFRFLQTWLRSPIAGQRCRVVATFNPPTDALGRWVIAYWGPWLDDRHPNPAMPGELRWFVSDEEGKDKEVPGPDPVDVRGKLVQPLSRTFIPSSVADNEYYAGTGYQSMLDSLPEPLRSQMRDGNFRAGMQDDDWQVIPSAWVRAAMDRWRSRSDASAYTAIGVDVARGGQDRTVISPRIGSWVAPFLVYKGTETPDGGSVAGHVAKIYKPGATVHVDVIGVGGSVVDHLKAIGIPAIPFNASESTKARGIGAAKLPFTNRRAEAWWRLREALDPDGDDPLALPNDGELLEELTSVRWMMQPGGIRIEPKDEIKGRLSGGRSPDKGDALAYSLVTPPPAPRIRQL